MSHEWAAGSAIRARARRRSDRRAEQRRPRGQVNSTALTLSLFNLYQQYVAHLRCGDTYAFLAAGFRVGIATVHRYIREAVDLLAALAPTLEQAMTTVRKKAYVILDGTVLPIDHIAAGRPYYSGKKKAHGMNVQVLADPAGRLIWASDVLPGAVHELTAARTHGIPAALAADDVKCRADKAYQGAGPAVRVPFRGKNLRGWRRRHNRDHAKIRSLGERAMATLKRWRLLRKLRCSTTRITPVVRAVVALELAT
ncbi:transposase family protein [Streptomyces niveus]|uniref:transposase family protein n=1 Tax=Streptomyces niveus TaxID=193462 RepID=UPI0036D981E5